MIINLLGQLCSPARDDLVVKAKNEPDVVNQMAQISNLLRLMRTDMTNYAIRQIRPGTHNLSFLLTVLDNNLLLFILQDHPFLICFQWYKNSILSNNVITFSNGQKVEVRTRTNILWPGYGSQ